MRRKSAPGDLNRRNQQRDNKPVMNIYLKKQKWKLGLFILAVIIGFSSLLVTNILVKKLAEEESKKVELWAEATRQIADMNSEITDFTFVLKVIQFNETVPVIVVDQLGEILDHRNLNPARSDNPEYLARQLESMKKKNEPIELEFLDNVNQYIYYGDSRLLIWLVYYPYIQLLVIILYLLIAYYAFSISRKAEQNQVWLGMSKETAHQLATPTSSLMAWLELMKEKSDDHIMLEQLEKDINRLEKITARFSKIGSKPVIKNEEIVEVIDNAIDYLKARSAKMIIFEKNYNNSGRVFVPVNIPLFEWVIENVCKNSLDAMEGKGKVSVSLNENGQNVYLDISDSGKGIPRGRFKTIFKPGYTTRRNGWGLGLSLSKRIIEDYHGGKIFVHESSPGTGTTIRIVLKKQPRV
ncbi:MAG: HAMP domain-containing sensor histidine kinase [Bacteroidales bacterium]